MVAETRSGPAPLLLIALDSFDRGLLDRWCAEGVLPNLSRLRAKGTVLNLSGGGLMDEVGSWYTMFSGQPPAVHGYYSGRRLKAGSYDLELISPQELDYVPFWRATTEAGLKAAILEAPEGSTIPDLNGIQLFNFCMHQEEYSRRPMNAVPGELCADIHRLMSDFEILRFDRFERRENYYRRQFRKNLHRLAGRNDMFRMWLDRQRYDLTIIGFAECHDAAHLLWPFHQRAGKRNAVDWGEGGPVREIYRAIDREIGEYLALYGPDCNVIVTSAYGIKSQYPCSVLGERLLQLLGYQVMRMQAARLSSPLSLLRAILPEPLRRRGSAWLPLDVQMKLDNERFSNGIDFRRSRAFNLTGVFSNWIRVNLVGREPLGMVQPGKEYEDLLDEIEHEFRQLTDPVSGEQPVSAVLRSSLGSKHDPLTSSLPDLYVHWRASDRFIDRLSHPAGELRQERPNFYRNSYHRLPGFAIVAGPGIGTGEEKHCSYLDFAPTCMMLLGLPADPAMPGTAVSLPGPEGRNVLTP